MGEFWMIVFFVFVMIISISETLGYGAMGGM